MNLYHNSKYNTEIISWAKQDHNSLLSELLEKYPQFDLEIEKKILGGIIFYPELFLQANKFITENDFYYIQNRHIWNIISDIVKSGRGLDPDSIQQVLNSKNIKVSIDSYTLPTPFYHTVSNGLLILKQFSMQRQFIGYCVNGISEVLERGDILEIQAKYSTLLLEMVDFVKNLKTKSKLDIGVNIMNRLEAAMAGGYNGIRTGLSLLDSITNGLQGGNLISLGSRTAQGKTALSLQIGYNASCKERIPGSIIQFEMSDEELGERLVSIHTSIPYQAMRTGQTTAVNEIGDAIDFINNSPFNRITETNRHIDNVCLTIRNEVKAGSKYVIIDYLDYIEGDGPKGMNQPDIIGLKVKKLKQLSLELNIPIILIVQLNRNTEHREDKKPTLSDLRSSGAIEFMSDIVLLLYRPDYYEKDETKLQYPVPGGETINMKNKAFLIVAKNKQGETMQMILNTDMGCSKFWNYSKDKIYYRDESYKDITESNQTPF